MMIISKIIKNGIIFQKCSSVHFPGGILAHFSKMKGRKSCISLPGQRWEGLYGIYIYGNRSKAPEKKTRTKATQKKPSDNKPPRIIEEIIAKYAVDVNLFRL